MTQLDAEFAGVSQIIDLWFASYKGPDGGMEGKGFEDAAAARAVLEAAAANFEAGRSVQRAGVSARLQEGQAGLDLRGLFTSRGTRPRPQSSSV